MENTKTMDMIRIITSILAVAFGISFFGGMFSWIFPSGFVTLLGFVDVVCIVWLLVLAYGSRRS